MKLLHIYLQNIEEIEEFVNTVNHIEGNVTLSEGRYTINAKSIIGIFCLDLSKQLDITVECWKNQYASMFRKFRCG